MRVNTCCQLGIECTENRCALMDMQYPDGSWNIGWIQRYGSIGVRIGNLGVMIAMAVTALSVNDATSQRNSVGKINEVSVRDVNELKEMGKVM